MRKITILLITIVVGILSISAATAKKSAPLGAASSQQQQPYVQPDSPDVVDGAKNPALIPDRVAYALLFRLIANRQTEVEKNRIRAYIRQMGLENEASGVADVDALIAAAEEFQQRASLLDMEAKEMKKRNRTTPNPVMGAQLKEMQHRKEAIVEEIVTSMPGRFSAPGLEIVRQHVKEHVKRKVKLHLRRLNNS